MRRQANGWICVGSWKVIARRWWLCFIHATTYRGEPCWTEYRLAPFQGGHNWGGNWLGWLIHWRFDITVSDAKP